MGFAQIHSRAQVGLAAPLVRVELHLGSGLPSFTIVGLAAPVVRESKERVRAALAHCGYELPAGRITVNLAPADLPKEGCRFDLAIALAILVASGQLRVQGDLQRWEVYGELGLTGEIKPVPGLLLAALHGGRAGHALLVARANAAEAQWVGCTDLALADTLPQAVALLAGTPLEPGAAPLPASLPEIASAEARCAPDLAEVRGQAQAKRALLIAAAGGHSLLMVGPPGAGKSMLAQRLPGLLPPLTHDEALEVAAIDAIAQRRAGMQARVRRPFRSPHHTASAHAIVGGGREARPGEVSLAHRGVLFLDELPEFDRRVLEALREPLETGVVSIARANLRADYPADFQLIAAMNPCHCGYHGDAGRLCRCSATDVERYRRRLSGPLLDRIDLHVALRRVPAFELTADALPQGLDTATAAAAVAAAQQLQRARQGCLNSRLQPAQLLRGHIVALEARQLLAAAAEQLALSARATHRVLKVARSIADLEQRAQVVVADVAEALLLRVPSSAPEPPGAQASNAAQHPLAGAHL